MTALPSNSTPSALRRLGRSLQHRNFRLFFLGQGVSLIGTWMQTLAMSWLVFALSLKETGSEEKAGFLLGVVNFAGQIPAILVVPFAGVLIDHWNRHRVIVIAQTLMLVQAGALTLLTWLQIIDIVQVIILTTFMGILNAFDMPARQAFLPEMLTNKEDLGNAIALNSSLFHGARLIGPSLAGWIIAWTGEGFCFLLNALSFLAVIIALLRMTVPPTRPLHQRSMVEGLREGVRYAFGFPPIRAMILLVGVISLVGMPYTVLMPLFASKGAGGGASGDGAKLLGWLMTASGVGALVGAIYMASRKTVLGLGRRIVLACALFAAGIMVFATSPYLWLSSIALVVCGFGMMVMMASCNTIVQTIVDDDKRGRVMSLYTTAFMGLAPFGSLVGGAIADAFGPAQALLLSGAGCLAAGLVFGLRLGALRRLIRPIYQQRGILPEAASGMRPVQDLCENAGTSLPAHVLNGEADGVPVRKDEAPA
jgi:MFS family permease